MAGMFRMFPCIRGDGGVFTRAPHPVIEEIAVTLSVNGRHAMTAMTSPVNLEEFITRYLYTEQVVRSLEEIESIRVEKNIVSVLTKNLRGIPGPKKVILSGCGGDASFLDVKKLPMIRSDLVLPYPP